MKYKKSIRKLSAFLLSALILVSSEIFYGINTYAAGIGDVNCDESVNSTDLILMKRYLCEWDVTIDINAADVNIDGQFNTVDIIILERSLAGWAENQPVEKYEELAPYASGFMTDPVYYYTAYYDVDFHIDRMSVEFNSDGNWFDITSDSNNSFTDNACMIEIPYTLTNPTVRIRAYYTEKVKKLDGTPKFELEGYRIKATLGDHTEYFTPSATPPVALININQIVPVNDYLKFDRLNAAGEKEEFYLALRPKSTSSLTVNGLSPTNLDKIFMASQDRTKRYYRKTYTYYARYNDVSTIKFFDATDKDSPNYDTWRTVLEDSINTFNSCLSVNGIGAHIEEVGYNESDNFVIFGEVPNDYAGICEYINGRFTVYVNADPNMLRTSNTIKAVVVHEMGHLLGFNDSAYAVDDSLYSYARDYTKVTYFQPSDITTIKAWFADR